MKHTRIYLAIALMALITATLTAAIRYPRARAVVTDQRNVTSAKYIEDAQIELGFCTHHLVTPITDGYNVACIQVYAGE